MIYALSVTMLLTSSNVSQAYTSVQRSPLQLTDHKELAHLMNTISFHTKMVDFLDEMLNETSDMSFFCFYYKQVLW